MVFSKQKSILHNADLKYTLSPNRWMQYLKNFLFIRTTSQGEKSEKGDLHNDQFVCLCLLINFILFFFIVTLCIIYCNARLDWPTLYAGSVNCNLISL